MPVNLKVRSEMKRYLQVGLILACLMAVISPASAQSPFANSGFKTGHVDVSSNDLYSMFPASGVLVRVTSVTSTTVFYVEGLKGFRTGTSTLDQVDSLFPGNYKLRGVSCFTTANEGFEVSISAYVSGSGKFTTSAWGTALTKGDVLALVPVEQNLAEGRYIKVDTGVIVSDNLNDGWDSTMFHPILDVTGLCRVQILTECVTALTDAAGASYVALGAVGATTAIIATTATTDVDAGIWINTSGETAILSSPSNAIKDYVSPGDDIGLTVSGADVTGGRLIFHCWVTPIGPGAGAIADNGQ